MTARNKAAIRSAIGILTIAFTFAFFPNPPASTQENRLTAQQVIDRIKKNVGVPWREQTVDTFKAGNPEAPITGVATTMMATFDVLKRAAASGKNLIITHEPTFYDHLDKLEDLEKENDAVTAAKLAFIKEHNLVVWRFHDHWHMRKPDGIQTGMVRALGWERFQSGDRGGVFVIPETTLGKLASDIKARLDIRTMRVIGDPNMKLTKVALAPGAPGFQRQRQILQRDDVEALLIGEAREWETIEYGDDAVAEGKRKALIVLGHIPSEQAGMDECARWLKTFVTEVPVEFIPAKEPFWAPK
jgi:putative NIF3 family GTP cyclohydrolase 1 type 2